MDRFIREFVTDDTCTIAWPQWRKQPPELTKVRFLRTLRDMDQQIRTRFAPSPTGYLHIGSVRTALFCYLFAKQHGGQFLLRIEDTDRSRYVEGSEKEIEQDLDWLGLTPDESPLRGGEFGPYTQSERMHLYNPFVQQLLEKSSAYRCFCTPEQLDDMRKKQQASGRPPKYNGTCRRLDPKNAAERAVSQPHVVRLKVPEDGSLEVMDMIKGKVVFDYKDIDDQVLVKSDGFPTYHLASVLDDHLMRISHVIRSEEWLPSTPKHIFLLTALGLPVPQYAHVPMVLNEKRAKLSKRKDGEMVWVKYYRSKGYLPQAVINFLALLGWSPKSTREVFALDELVNAFDLATVSKSGAVFDVKRLNHVNGLYLRQMKDADYLEVAREFLKKKGLDAAGPSTDAAMLLERERLEYFDQIGEHTAFVFVKELALDVESLRWKTATNEQISDALTWAYERLDSFEGEWDAKGLETYLIQEVRDAKKTNGDVLFPLRYAITGQKYSPTPFECLAVLGKVHALKRIDNARKLVVA